MGVSSATTGNFRSVNISAIFSTMLFFQNFAKMVTELVSVDESQIGWIVPSHRWMKTVCWLWVLGGPVMNGTHTCLDSELTSKDEKGRSWENAKQKKWHYYLHTQNHQCHCPTNPNHALLYLYVKMHGRTTNIYEEDNLN